MADQLKQKAVVIVKKIDEKKMAAKEETSQEAGQAIAREVAMAMTNVLKEHHDRPNPVRLSIRPDYYFGYQTEDSARWLAKYVTYADMQTWGDAQKISALALFLKGPAKLWYLENRAGFGANFVRMEQMFLARFGVEANRTAAEEQLILRRQSPHETLEAYSYDLRSMCHRLGKNRRDTVAAFIRGLLPNIKGQVAVLQPADMDEVERIARTATTYAPPTPLEVAQVHVNPLQTLTSTLGQLIEEIRSDRKPVRGHGDVQRDHRPEPVQRYGGPTQGRGRGQNRQAEVSPGYLRNPDIICHRCSKRGHIARLCRAHVNDLPQENVPL